MPGEQEQADLDSRPLLEVGIKLRRSLALGHVRCYRNVHDGTCTIRWLMGLPVFILLVQLDADVSIHGFAVPPFDQGSHRVPAYERVQLFILAMPFDRASHGGCKRIVASHGVKASIAKAYQHKFTLQRSDMHSHGDGTDYVHHVVARQSVQRERIPFLRVLSQ